MRGSVNYQINKISMESGIFQPGTSRHDAKNDVREVLASDGCQASSHAVASRTGIYSYNSFEKYKDIWHQFGRFCRAELNLKDMLKLGVEHVHEYLEYRAEVDQVSWQTFQLEAAALNKFDDVLNRFCEKHGVDSAEYDFSRVIADVKAEFKDVLQNGAGSVENRGYGDPESVGKRVERSDHQIAWKLALEGGGRISEVTYIRESQLREIQIDRYTGKEVGVITVKGKGGLERQLMISPETYWQLGNALAHKGGLFQVYQNALRSSVRQAAGDEYRGRGVHGARYNFAQDRYVELTRAGYSHEQTIRIVSGELGHHRGDITLRYLAM